MSRIIDPKVELIHYNAKIILDSMILLEDGSYMLDLFSDFFLQILKGTDQIVLVEDSYNKIEYFIEKYSTVEPDEKILSKYLLLRHFFDKNKAKWKV